MRPLIGVTTSMISAQESGTMDRFTVAGVYCRAVLAAGGSPVLIPGLGDAEAVQAVFPHLDGVLFTGGPDIDPARYGQELHPACERIDDARDVTELVLATLVRQSQIPVLGICRGIQLINVAWGGTLVQDLAAQRPGTEDHRFSIPEPPRIAHTLTLLGDSTIARALGATSIPANSLHHQAVDRPGTGLVVTAHAADGTAEAIELPGNRFVVGVQCHPEHLYQQDRRWLGLFAALVEAARRPTPSRLVSAG
ncbi:MAG TPA: gamma-glutamyl-gamma-aminobutyrate hydrolase family protein [Chloroflexota bacterium]|nr:gamma-glutamyl-gamma-aminobutyrate hydrolase family protein [Chloroflexota bacterium]